MDWLSGAGAVLGVVVGLIGVVSFLGAVVVYLRGSRDKGTISTLAQNNEALTARVKLLEDSEIRLKAEADAAATTHKAELDALRLRLDTLEQTNAELRAQRPSAEAIEAVYALVQAVHRDTQLLVKGLLPQ